MKRCSLRIRLLRILLIPVALAYVIIGISSYYSAYHEAEEIYDAQLTHFAKVLRALTQREVEENDVSAKRVMINDELELHEYEKNFAYRVWLGKQIILHSSNAERFGPAAAAEGFLERIIQGQRWRFFVLRDNNVTVEVAERYEVRIDLIQHILQGIFLPQLLIIPSLGLIIWLGVISGLRPLKALSDLIRRRNPDNLERIDAPIVPQEIAPVVDAINDLMKRVSDVMEREKQFSNYAAHELRTPLAALKTQLQVALRTEDAGQARTMFRELLPAIDRMQHLVEQLLSFVRIKADCNYEHRVNLVEVCQEVLRDLAPLAVRTRRELISELTAPAIVKGNAEMLSVLVRNLVSNALKYTSEGGHVHISLQTRAGDVELRVADDGIGIAEKDCCNIFESFYRVAGTDTEGCGLGLAIVKAVADMHHAKIELTEGLGGRGAGFTITFPVFPV
ncbi:ATP-binding protein [Sulfuriflexus sp.]|uniref:ATP-binding protein n=1 Tax=Sulfuriflexus sp. TaxID=2015443 RepID=UPI0028CE5492|nr:ATP-binding protein [Sulfuriflexus sp.]MDT8403421.1 ATP-binding protein [Sulfuriflexus sp.]